MYLESEALLISTNSGGFDKRVISEAIVVNMRLQQIYVENFFYTILRFFVNRCYGKLTWYAPICVKEGGQFPRARMQ